MGLKLRVQERVNIGVRGSLQFDIDLVLDDVETGATRYVLDTKYNTPGIPATSDISQVITCAELKRCREASLIYPTALAHPLNEKIGNIHIRSLTFALNGDLEQVGQTFLDLLQM
jgi:5-methylcytosine-specific restriction enzyme subunit McrC